MGWKYGQNDPIFGAVVDKLHRNMAPMAVKYKKAPFPLSFGLCISIKDVDQPGQPVIIIGPAGWCSCYMDQVVTGWYIVYPSVQDVVAIT